MLYYLPLEDDQLEGQTHHCYQKKALLNRSSPSSTP